MIETCPTVVLKRNHLAMHSPMSPTLTATLMCVLELMRKLSGRNGSTMLSVLYNKSVVGLSLKSGSRLYILRSRVHIPTMAKIPKLENVVTQTLQNLHIGPKVSFTGSLIISIKKVRCQICVVSIHTDYDSENQTTCPSAYAYATPRNVIVRRSKVRQRS